MIRTSPSVSYSIWLKRILDTHASQAWNAEPTDVREREDEELNGLWSEITEGQTQRLWGLSSDLYTLRDQEKWVESDWPRLNERELAEAQNEAFQRKHWDKLLEYLRRPPRFLPRPLTDYLRGRAWMELGHPEVALLFFDNAARLDPENSTYGVLSLECLKSLQDWPEILRRCDRYAREATTPAVLLFRAADALHAYADHTGSQEHYEKALRAVEIGFRNLAQNGQDESLSAVIVGAYATKSLCLEHLGRTQDALQVLDQAIMRYPEKASLLAARGLLKQQLGRADDARDDFQQAANRAAAVAWPYLELARHALDGNRQDEAAEICRQGLALVPQGGPAALLHEMLAVALFRLNQPRESVRAELRTAAQLDPLSEQIRFNREEFERLASQPGAKEPRWQLASIAPVVAIEDVCSQLQPLV